MTEIGIVNYGMGNIASVNNAINHIGFNAFIINNPADFRKADKVILPGVGAFPRAIENISYLGLSEALNEYALVKKKYILGLCLGMQLLFEDSEEHGHHKGLNWIEGNVLDLKKHVHNLPIPHMGWNTILKKGDNLLLKNIPEDQLDFYFVHNYFCKCKNPSESIANLEYGIPIDVMVQKENIFGCQFHPEKSQKSGLQLLKNFCEL